MLPDRPARTLLTALVYLTAITLGSGLLVRDPTAPFAVIPLAVGVVLLAHAWRTTHFDELGYAIAWLWVAVLALSVGTALLAALGPLGGDLVPLVDASIARLAGTLGLTAVLVAAYVLLVRRTCTAN